MSNKSQVTNFIRNIIVEDLNNGTHSSIRTRFPPEPNGFLHIGHAKAICLNFGIIKEFSAASCNLRFDDTNPEKESNEYVEAIKEDVKWLGFTWNNDIKFASDYFSTLYKWALQLIKDGNAYVCDLSAEEIKKYRGTLTQPGRDSPYRERTIKENLQLFENMKTGSYLDGAKVLRAKIDMASGNLNLRDPVIYRIKHVTHHRQGNKWSIYPTYDYTHGLCDAIEGITHSLCTLEFQDHRPLYDWFLHILKIEPKPRQIEFARLNVSYTITSKRKLKQLVDQKHVLGWNDPRMPTISGMRRRGYPAAAIRDFCERIGVSKKETTIDINLLEDCVRDNLNLNTLRKMAVTRPLKMLITNYDEGKTEQLEVCNHPQNPQLGTRNISFSRTLWLEKDDFMLTPSGKFNRLSPGKEVRLRYSYIVRCDDVIHDEAGNIIEIHCSYDPKTLGKKPIGRKVKGVIHWVDASSAISATIKCYDRLFTHESPGATANTDDDSAFIKYLKKESLSTLDKCFVEASLKTQQGAFQFERLGYFVNDMDSCRQRLVFNSIVPLRSSI